jgi:NAD(P)-dependent dehydrogenase (short-subunit alcohol dehydrogenase family)
MRSALITGGTGGLGRAVTETFLDRGFRCVVPFVEERQSETMREALGEREAEGRLVLAHADLFEEGSVAEVARAADDAGAPLHAAVNLVGGFDAPGPVHEVPVERFEAQLRINLRPAYLVCAAVLPGMLARGTGAIVCVSSRAALRPFPGAAGYVTAKAGVLAFVDALASECTPAGVRVNAVVPGIIDTPANRASQPDADHSRWTSPAEVAQAIAYLCSEEASAIAGAHVPVYGQS